MVAFCAVWVLNFSTGISVKNRTKLKIVMSRIQVPNRSKLFDFVVILCDAWKKDELP